MSYVYKFRLRTEIAEICFTSVLYVFYYIYLKRFLYLIKRSSIVEVVRRNNYAKNYLESVSEFLPNTWFFFLVHIFLCHFNQIYFTFKVFFKTVLYICDSFKDQALKTRSALNKIFPCVATPHWKTAFDRKTNLPTLLIYTCIIFFLIQLKINIRHYL